ncbi:hypothetical protein BU25DRAFT_413019 [Macroventuria anomochaeta]|uniref:Uncharacterized protein n=1 Tax=Macroventuria anomochaeta TaxID=301207 RepID=A0ACB6RU73_9PLEO|nr:uncharacterized protein BU25DRAFT_413019 [Macroventuria anomochaeta]KAF2624837.1 hypothetical protein BU25DRAFT_413019 [Macroventuria anomochaeta]
MADGGLLTPPVFDGNQNVAGTGKWIRGFFRVAMFGNAGWRRRVKNPGSARFV